MRNTPRNMCSPIDLQSLQASSRLQHTSTCDRDICHNIVTFWPHFLAQPVTAAIDYICTKFGVDS